MLRYHASLNATSIGGARITVFGEGRGFRVVWLLEEMGLAYRLRPVDLLAGVGKDTEFLAINPAGFIPAIRDGDVTMVECFFTSVKPASPAQEVFDTRGREETS